MVPYQFHWNLIIRQFLKIEMYICIYVLLALIFVVWKSNCYTNVEGWCFTGDNNEVWWWTLEMVKGTPRDWNVGILCLTSFFLVINKMTNVLITFVINKLTTNVINKKEQFVCVCMCVSVSVQVCFKNKIPQK